MSKSETLKEIKMSDTLNDTFASFFGSTEETDGTGAVVRVIDNELTEVVVDNEEREAFLQDLQDEADAQVAEFWHGVELVEQVNS
jgi:hypothetical protein